MSGEREALPARGCSRSYGSLVRSPRSPGPHGRIEHTLQPGETLQGLALKYGVTTEQIKRTNRLYTNESIFLKRSLSIPVMADPASASAFDGPGRGDSEGPEDGGDIADLAPDDFLRRLDGLINQSKSAAVQRCQDAEKRISALESACSGRSAFKRSQSVILAPRRPTAVTVAKLSGKLWEKEDEIFPL